MPMPSGPRKRGRHGGMSIRHAALEVLAKRAKWLLTGEIAEAVKRRTDVTATVTSTTATISMKNALKFGQVEQRMFGRHAGWRITSEGFAYLTEPECCPRCGQALPAEAAS